MERTAFCFAVALSRGDDRLYNEFDAQQKRHKDRKVPHRRLWYDACHEAPDQREAQNGDHHDQAVSDIEILIFPIGIGRDGAGQYVARQRDTHREIWVHVQKGDEHGADHGGGAHSRKSRSKPCAEARYDAY